MQHPRPRTYYPGDGADPMTVRGNQIKLLGGQVILDGSVDQVIQSILEVGEGLEDTWFQRNDSGDDELIYLVFGWREMDEEQLARLEVAKVEHEKRQAAEKQRQEDYDRVNYLRLKARFEPEPIEQKEVDEEKLKKTATRVRRMSHPTVANAGAISTSTTTSNLYSTSSIFSYVPANLGGLGDLIESTELN